MHEHLAPPAKRHLRRRRRLAASADAGSVPAGVANARRLEHRRRQPDVVDQLAPRATRPGGDVAVALLQPARVLVHRQAELGALEQALQALGVAGDVGEQVPPRPARQLARGAGLGPRSTGHRLEVGDEGGVGVDDPLHIEHDAERIGPAGSECDRIDGRCAATGGDVARFGHGTRDDRARPDGRQHGAPAHRGRPQVRGLRRLRRRRRRAHRRGDDRRAVAGRPRRPAHRAAPRVDDGAGGLRRRHDRRAGPAARARRHDHRRRQLVVPRRHRPRPIAGRRPRHRLRRRRHQWRHPRPRAGVLPDDRRARRRGGPPRPDLRLAGTGRRRRRAHAQPRCAAANHRAPPSTAGCTAARAVPGTS